MDIGFVSNVVYPFVKGGAEKRIHEIGRRLAADGHEVTIYGRHFWEGPKVRYHEGMRLHAVAPKADLYADDRRSISEALDFSARLLPSLRRAVSERQHDVLVASVFPYFPVLSSKLATLGHDVPLVTTWHEVWDTYWEEYLGALAPFGKGIERLTAHTPQHPIAVSDVTASNLAALGPDYESIRVVPNGIDVDTIQSLSGSTDGYDVLFAGRLIEHKNVDMLLDAFDTVTETATLGILGDGPEAERLQSHAAELDCADRIDFLGFLEEHDDVLGHMVGADIFASPSTREGFGITFAEAMAADCTVIAVDHDDSAAAEVVGDGGFVVPPSADDLGTAIRRALDGETPQDDPVARASQFDWDSVASQAVTAYDAALSGTW